MNYTIALIIMIVIGGSIGYLSGSILFAIIIGKLFKQQDITKTGSNNPGFTNSTRIYGKKISILVLILDILKTVLPVLVFLFIYNFSLKQYCLNYITSYYNPGIFIYIPGIFSIIGHVFPIFYKFKGGKGVSSFGGLCICLSPFIAIIGILIIVVCIKLTKKMSIGSLIGAFATPFLVLVPGVNYLYLMYPNISECVNIAINNTIIFVPIFVGMLLLSFLIIYRHKENIKKLLNNTEIPIATKQ